MRRLWIAFALVACHAEPPPKQVAAAPPSECPRVGDHLVELMPAAAKAKPEQLDPLRNLITTRCREDHWSDEAQRCFLGIHALADGEACRAKLTPEQAAALDHDGRASVEDSDSADKKQER